MNQRLFVSVCPFAAIALVLLSGCFSAVARSGEGWSGAKTSTEAKVIAGAADIATLPIQAPLLAVAGVREAGRQASLAKKEKYLTQIRNDPEFIFQRKLHLAGYYDGRGAVYEALWDYSINFTDAQLRRLYKEMNWDRVYVLANPHCSAAFLKEIWDPINASDKIADWQKMEQFVRNPSLPKDWLETIAKDKRKYGNSSNAAEAILSRGKKPNQ